MAIEGKPQSDYSSFRASTGPAPAPGFTREPPMTGSRTFAEICSCLTCRIVDMLCAMSVAIGQAPAQVLQAAVVAQEGFQVIGLAVGADHSRKSELNRQ